MTHNLYSTLSTVLRHFFVPFDILSFDICPIRHYFYLTFCPIRCYLYSTFCTIRHYVPFGLYYFQHYVSLAFCPIRHFVRSAFCIIWHFLIQHCVPFNVLSFYVLFFRPLLLRHFVGESFLCTLRNLFLFCNLQKLLCRVFIISFNISNSALLKISNIL